MYFLFVFFYISSFLSSFLSCASRNILFVEKMSEEAENDCVASADLIRRAVVFSGHANFNALSLEGAELRLQKVEETWDEYRKAFKIVRKGTAAADIEKLMDKFDIVQTNFFKAASAYKVKINTLKATTVQANRTEKEPVKVSIEMPQGSIRNIWGKFDGNERMWSGFRDRFIAAVHNNDKIEPSFKFQHLQDSLSGDAAKTLAGWQLSNDCYVEAWDRLNEVYNKKYTIRRSHLRHFLQMKQIQAPATRDDLQGLSNASHEMIRQLRAEGLPVDHWNFLIVHCIHERLDEETGRRWELQRLSLAQPDDPTAKQILGFVDQQATAAPIGRRSDSTDSLKVQRISDTSVDSDHSKDKSTEHYANKSTGRKFNRSCEACHGTHHVWECSEFRALSFSARKEFVQRRNICPNCLKTGHKENQCFQSKCVRCPGAPAHNILLCPSRELNKQVMPSTHVQETDEYASVRRGKFNQSHRNQDGTEFSNDANRMYDNRLEILNDKLDLIEQKEKLLDEKLGIVGNKRAGQNKENLDCGIIGKKNKKDGSYVQSID